MVIDLNPKYDLEITRLMWFQECHNRYYHQDIYHLQLMPTLNHFYKHIMKYHSRIESARLMEQDYNHIIIDGLICCISALSTLRYNPMRTYKNDYKGSTFHDLNMEAVMPRWDDLTRIGVRIGKALEGFDHLEDINYRQTLCAAFTDMFLVHWGLWLSNGNKSFIRPYVARLQEIKRNNIFHDYLVEVTPKFSLDGVEIK